MHGYWDQGQLISAPSPALLMGYLQTSMEKPQAYPTQTSLVILGLFGSVSKERGWMLSSLILVIMSHIYNWKEGKVNQRFIPQLLSRHRSTGPTKWATHFLQENTLFNAESEQMAIRVFRFSRQEWVFRGKQGVGELWHGSWESQTCLETQSNGKYWGLYCSVTKWKPDTNSQIQVFQAVWAHASHYTMLSVVAEKCFSN